MAGWKAVTSAPVVVYNVDEVGDGICRIGRSQAFYGRAYQTGTNLIGKEDGECDGSQAA